MAQNSLIQVRVDESLKAQADKLFSALGIDTPTAIRMFLKQAIMRDGIPFKVSLDPFYGEGNMRAIDESLEQLKQGKVVIKTLAELEEMENE